MRTLTDADPKTEKAKPRFDCAFHRSSLVSSGGEWRVKDTAN